MGYHERYDSFGISKGPVPVERGNGPFPPRPAFKLGNERDAALIAKQSGRPIEEFLGSTILAGFESDQVETSDQKEDN